MGRGNKNLIFKSRSHDQDGRHILHVLYGDFMKVHESITMSYCVIAF